MRKISKVMLCVAALGCSMLLCGCAKEKKAEPQPPNRFELVGEKDATDKVEPSKTFGAVEFAVVRDTETGCEFIIAKNGRGGFAMLPRDGKTK